MTIWQTDDRLSESFQAMLLRHRGRTGLTQREVAARVGASTRSVQDWENGVNYPSAERLKRLISVLLKAGGLSAGYERVEAEALWDTVERAAPRMRAPFDHAWFTGLLVEGASTAAASDEAGAVSAAERRQDWGEAPDVLGFVGRTDELATLRGWVLDTRCRLVAVLGMGGIGKTSLAARLAQDVAATYERVYWRCLRDAPPAREWLAGAIGFLSDQQLVPPASESEQLAALLGLLRDRRCLLVLDNMETLFESDQWEGRYRTGLDGYGRLLRAVAEAAHQSCLVLTSRDKPVELAVLNGGGIRTLALGGLGDDEARVLLAPKDLSGSREEWDELVARFGGNGLALNVVGESIRELFGGEIGTFLAEVGSDTVFGGIRRLLAEQVERSSAPEQHVLRALAVAREPLHLVALLTELGPRVGRGAVVEAIEGLRHRSLVERTEVAGAGAFTLQSVVLEYVTERLVEDIADAIELRRPAPLAEQPLIQAQTKEYVRQMQERLIGTPILQQLSGRHGEGGSEQRMLALLEDWRDRPMAEQGCGPGNVVNLLRLLRGHLRGLDLSHLAIRQAYLADVDAQDASLVGVHLAETVLAEAFSLPVSVALSADGALLAAGTSTGEIWLWRVADRVLVATLEGHTGGVRNLALSADGTVLVSGGQDGRVRLWDTNSGLLLATLDGQSGDAFPVALSADGFLVAAAGDDGAVSLWQVTTRQRLATVRCHSTGHLSVALSADGRILACGGQDGLVSVWDTSNGRLVATMQGNIGPVHAVALASDGRLAASCGADSLVRLWDTTSGQVLATLRGHTGPVWGVSLSMDGELVASGGADAMVLVWEAQTGRRVATVQGHRSVVRGVALTADGQLLASCGIEGSVRLWETTSGRLLSTFHGHTGEVRGVALAAQGQIVASGGAETAVRLWDTTTGVPLASLDGHAGGVWSVALAADGQLLASGGFDGTIRCWSTTNRRLLARLEGHLGVVLGVALSDHGDILASCGEDGTARIWRPSTGEQLAVLWGHTGTVRDVALSADGRLLASAGADGTVRLWETSSGRPLATIAGHTAGIWGVALAAGAGILASGGADGTLRLWQPTTGRPVATVEVDDVVRSVALSADGTLLVSGGADGAVRVFEVRSGRLLATLRGHTGMVRRVALSPDGQRVVSGSVDGTVRLWESTSGTCLRVLGSPRRYEGVNIAGLVGVTAAQRRTLLALGAVEQRGDDARPAPA